MRLIKTFILHLYFDTDEPDRLCGNLRTLEDPENYPFKSQIEFETILHQLIKKPPRPETVPTEMNLNPDE